VRGLPALALALAAACSNSPPASGALPIRLIAPTGANAAAGVEEGALVIEVARDGRVDRVEAEIRDGDFLGELRLDDDDALTGLVRIQGALTSRDGPSLWGALPAVRPISLRAPFRPRMLFAAPGCHVLDLEAGVDRRFELPRRLRGPVALPWGASGTSALVLGGLDRDGAPADRLARLETVDLVDLSPDEERGPFGEVRALALTPELVVVVADGQATPVRASDDETPREEAPLPLYDGAGAGSAALVWAAELAAVLGGDAGGANAVRWLGVTAEGALEIRARGTVPGPREQAAVAALSGGLLVLGGGTPAAAWVPFEEDGVLLDLTLDDASGGFLLPSPDRERALWVGRRLDEVRSDTWLIEGCPDACVANPGPAWSRARDGAALVETVGGGPWLVGGRSPDGTVVGHTDRVLWEAGGPRFVPGPDLAEPLAEGAAIEHAAGTFFVFGGVDGAGELQRRAQWCVPDALDAF
jgi:hypothetical protein